LGPIGQEKSKGGRKKNEREDYGGNVERETKGGVQSNLGFAISYEWIRSTW
jgi:hypothetical protein